MENKNKFLTIKNKLKETKEILFSKKQMQNPEEKIIQNISIPEETRSKFKCDRCEVIYNGSPIKFEAGDYCYKCFDIIKDKLNKTKNFISGESIKLEMNELKDARLNLKNYKTVINGITRFELINHCGDPETNENYGREKVILNKKYEIEVQLQDENKTLKVFYKEKKV